MYCNRCATQNPDDASICIKCGIDLVVIGPKTSNDVNKKSTFEQLHIVSEEIEKLDFIYKLGFYISGVSILFMVTLYSLFIAPVLIYLLGGRGWPKNILVKAAIYNTVVGALLLVIVIVIGIVVILAAVIAAFIFGIGESQI